MNLGRNDNGKLTICDHRILMTAKMIAKVLNPDRPRAKECNQKSNCTI